MKNRLSSQKRLWNLIVAKDKELLEYERGLTPQEEEQIWKELRKPHRYVSKGIKNGGQ